MPRLQSEPKHPALVGFANRQHDQARKSTVETNQCHEYLRFPFHRTAF